MALNASLNKLTTLQFLGGNCMQVHQFTSGSVEARTHTHTRTACTFDTKMMLVFLSVTNLVMTAKRSCAFTSPQMYQQPICCAKYLRANTLSLKMMTCAVLKGRREKDEKTRD